MTSIPFFELFPSLELGWEERKKLSTAYLTAVEVRKEEGRMTLELTVPESLGEEGKDEVETAIVRAYGLGSAEVHERVEAPPDKAKAPGEAVLFGAAIKGETVPIETLNPKSGGAVVFGKVFFADFYETRRPGVWCLTFELTDFHSSVRVTKYLEKGEKDQLKKPIAPGMWLKVQGRVKLGRDGSEILLEPRNIVQCDHPFRQDTAPVKRVELHLHTTFSAMDALCSLDPKAGPEENVVKRAEAWCHPAIAITDHGVAQGFPDAWHCAKKIKLVDGMEG